MSTNLVLRPSGDSALSGAIFGKDLKEDEKILISTLVNNLDADVELIMSKDVPLDEFEWKMQTMVNGYVNIKHIADKIKPILGRMMAVLSERPDLLEAFGAKNISDFAQRVMPERFNIARNDAWALMSYGKNWGYRSPDLYHQVGPGRLAMIARAVPLPDNADPETVASIRHTRDDLIAFTLNPDNDSKKVTNRKLAEHIESRGICSADQVMPSMIKFKCTKDLADEWAKLMRSNKVMSYLGIKSGAGMEQQLFRRMIEECSAQWIADAEQAHRTERAMETIVDLEVPWNE